ncbi:MAG: hypothetical protein IJR89_00785 [Clostridia bacterium]|nr:hypothetical protein [Clostridia bacterium]
MNAENICKEWQNDPTDRKRGKAIELGDAAIVIKNIRRIEIKEEKSTDAIRIEFVKEIDNEETTFVILCQKVSNKLPPLPIKRDNENIHISWYQKTKCMIVEVYCGFLFFPIVFFSGYFHSIDSVHESNS